MINKKLLLLFDACRTGNLSYISNNLDFDYVNYCDENKKTLLHVAASNNDSEMINTILKFLPNVNVEDKNHLLPISYLIKNNNLKCIKNIIENYNGVFSNQQLFKNLSIACMYDNVEIIKYLYERLNFDKDIVDKSKNTLLMIAAKFDSIRTYRYLIKIGCNVNLENADGNTAIYFAITANSFTIYQDLANKTKLDHQNESGVSPLMVAVLYKRYNIINSLQSKSINQFLKDYDGNNALHYAVLNDDDTATMLLIESKPDLINEQNLTGNTPFMISLINGNDNLAELMLHYQINFELKNNENVNPFEITWQKGNIKIAKMILSQYKNYKASDLNFDRSQFDEKNIEDITNENINKLRDEIDLNFEYIDNNLMNKQIEDDNHQELNTNHTVVNENQSDVSIKAEQSNIKAEQSNISNTNTDEDQSDNINVEVKLLNIDNINDINDFSLQDEENTITQHNDVNTHIDNVDVNTLIDNFDVNKSDSMNFNSSFRGSALNNSNELVDSNIVFDSLEEHENKDIIDSTKYATIDDQIFKINQDIDHYEELFNKNLDVEDKNATLVSLDNNPKEKSQNVECAKNDNIIQVDVSKIEDNKDTIIESNEFKNNSNDYEHEKDGQCINDNVSKLDFNIFLDNLQIVQNELKMEDFSNGEVKESNHDLVLKKPQDVNNEKTNKDDRLLDLEVNNNVKSSKNINYKSKGKQMDSSFSKKYNIKWLISENEFNNIVNGKIDAIFMDSKVKVTPIMYFAKIGKTKNIFEILKDDPTRINDRASNNKTALMFASQFNNLNCVKLLLLVGSNVNDFDDHKATSLMYAVHMGNIEIVKLLLDNGADVNMKDINGISAFDIASWKNNKEIMELLISHNKNCQVFKNTDKTYANNAECI